MPDRAPLPVARAFLEVALDYRCNLRCLGCHACHDTGERLDASEAMTLLRHALAGGTRGLWIGGGEPTLRDDLLSLVAAARRLGFERVVVQTNGMRLAYAAYAEALAAAGVTTLRFNVKSADASVHDALSGAPSHALLLQGIEHARGRGIRLEADVLLTRRTVPDLPRTVATFAERGIEGFFLWLLSAADEESPEVRGEVPRMTEVAPFLRLAHEEAMRRGVTLASYHTPPCVLPEDLRGLYTPASSLSLTVVGPDRRPFALEDSPFEGGVYLPACEGCRERPRCGGLRSDYLAVHGAGEFAAV